MRIPIKGFMSFEKVEIEPIPDEMEIEVRGWYDGEHSSTIRASPVFINEMEVDPDGEGVITLHGTDWIWAHSDHKRLLLTDSKPGEDQTSESSNSSENP